MKIRQGFVSNSSSASFIVRKVNLSQSQRYLIENFEEEALKSDLEYPEEASGWSMYEGDEHYSFSTIMDNFHLHEFFEQHGIVVENYDNS